MSLIEVTVTAGILGMLLAVIFGFFVSGSSAWMKVDARTDLVQTFEAFGSQWASDVNQSELLSDSMDAGGDALSLTRAVGSTQSTASLSAGGLIQWNSFRVYYYDSASQSVLRRDLDLGAPNADVLTIDQTNLGSGLHPLGSYLNSGRVLLQFVSACQFQASGQSLTLSLSGSKQRYGNSVPESFQLNFLAMPRN